MHMKQKKRGEGIKRKKEKKLLNNIIKCWLVITLG